MQKIVQVNHAKTGECKVTFIVTHKRADFAIRELVKIVYMPRESFVPYSDTITLFQSYNL